MSSPSCSEQSTNPAGTTTGVPLGLSGTLEVSNGEGSTAGVRVARLTTAITDATKINTAATASVTKPRRSHLLDGLLGADSILAAASSAVLGEGSAFGTASDVVTALGASFGDR